MIPDTSAVDRPIQGPSRLRRWRFAAPIAVAGLVGGWFAASPVIARWRDAGASIEASRLRTGVVVRGDLVRDVHVEGRLVSGSHPTLFSVAPGIVHLNVRPGELVSEGQVLARVESTSLESELQQEAAALQSLRSDYERQKIANRQRTLSSRQDVDLARVGLRAAEREKRRAEETAAEGVMSRRDLERARDDADIARLKLEHARQSLAQQSESLAFELRNRESRVARQAHVVADLERRIGALVVRSPVAGLAAELFVEDRDAVGERQPLVKVVDLRVFEIDLEIPEGYADDVIVGARAEVKIEDRVHEAVVSRVAPSVSDGRVRGTATFAAEQPEGLRQNQRVGVRIILETRDDVIVAPRGAYVDDGGAFVYVVRGEVARRVPVELGAAGIREVEVVRGLAPGDEIVLSDLGRLDGEGSILLY